MQESIYSRRAFLSTSALAVGAAAAAHTPLLSAEMTARKADMAASIPTHDTILKFNSDGAVRPFRGNTVICHLQPQGTTRDAVERVASELRRSSFIRKIALLPSDSYHMTVYPGANDQDRDITGWPSDIPRDASIDECNRIVGERMRQFSLDCDLPLRMRLDSSMTINRPRASTLRMVGANELEEKKIRTLRDRLVDVFGFRDREHDKYGFHISLAYQLQPFTSTEQASYRQILEATVPQIVRSAPVFEFGNPEFCTFPDMYRFNVQTLLSQRLLSA